MTDSNAPVPLPPKPGSARCCRASRRAAVLVAAGLFAACESKLPRESVAPIAEFTVSVMDLELTVDGSASHDVDGSVVSWTWDFGDGQTASGATPASHPYGAAGNYTVTLTVKDDQSLETSRSQQVTVTAPNQAPVAAFTASVSALTVTVDGSASSDADGTLVDHAWDFGDGTTDTGAVPGPHTYATVGPKVVTLTVTDDRGLANSVSKSIVTGISNQSPVASFTLSANNLAVTVDGSSSSDADGSIASFDWDFGDGAQATGATPAPHTYAAAGMKTIRLTVTDDQGATSALTRTISVAAANQLPTASFTATVNALTVTVNASASSDVDGSIASYAWTFGDGATATGPTPAPHTYAASGMKSISLTVTDNNGGVGTSVKTVNVAPSIVNQLPTAAFTTAVNNLSVTVNGSSSSDPDGTIVGYAWNFGDGTTATGVTPAAHVYATAGTKTITLTVTDNNVIGGAGVGTASKSVVVTAPNQLPTAAFTTTVNNLSVTVNGSTSSDPDGTIASYAWNFGDGATATGATPPAHTYASAGTRSISLVVTDNRGGTGTATKSVTVTAPGNTAPGASLPISYSLASLTGTIWYVATTGVDSAAGTLAAPLHTLQAAIAKVPSGQSATVVVRGGEYTEGNVSIPGNRAIRIIAYPGEVPVFTGAQKFASGWIVEGALAYHAYTEQPVTDGSGISFTTGQNLTAGQVGKYPDQAWIDTTELRQVATKAEVVAGKFWVDATNHRLYLAGTDAAKTGIEASLRDIFITVDGAGSTLEGLQVMRFSNSANDYGVIRVQGTADNVTLRNVEVIDAAFISVSLAGGTSHILQAPRLEHVTINGANWMGVTSVYVDNLTLDYVKVVGNNAFGEFTFSPQSGGMKTSRNRGIKVLNSDISNNNSHGLWFDQSNVGVVIAATRITNNSGSAVFFEISDDLLLIDSYIKAVDRAVKISGSSGAKLVNNTIVGGIDGVGLYTDMRSITGCADPSQPLCAGSYSSDRDVVRTLPASLDWKPRLDLLLNNIVAYPTATGYCGAATTLCATSSNGAAMNPPQTIIHQADPARGIPQTRMDGNVYANGAGSIVRISGGSYATPAAWSAAAAGAPILISGLDANSKSGNALVNPDGSATAALDHSQAIAVPTDALINAYVPAGTKHFGWLH